MVVSKYFDSHRRIQVHGIAVKDTVKRLLRKDFCRGFDGSLAKNIAMFGKFGTSESKAKTQSNDQHLLAEAFYRFSKADLASIQLITGPTQWKSKKF